MRGANLGPSTQLVLIGLLVVVGAAFVTRSVIFFRRENAGEHLVYPSTWSAGQCRTLESFRLLLGLALIPLWAIFLCGSALMLGNGSFGYVEVISLICMLLISHAWVILLTPSDWKKLDAFPRSFWVTMAFLVVWWGTAFTAISCMMFVEASASPQLRTYSGVFAAHSNFPYKVTGG
jgi:hypothetical protein